MHGITMKIKIIPIHFIWHFCFHIEWLIYILRQNTGKAGVKFEVFTMKKLLVYDIL